MAKKKSESVRSWLEKQEQEQVEEVPKDSIRPEEQRRAGYIHRIEANWPKSTGWRPRTWIESISRSDIIVRGMHKNGMPRMGPDPSLTLIKSLAIMSFWMSLDDAKMHLEDRIEARRATKGNNKSKNTMEWYCKPADVKWVLLNKLTGVGEGMDWEFLAGDALGYDYGD